MDTARILEAAKCGNRDAAWQLGNLYREALLGLRYSPRSAFRWYAESALAGSATGQNNVGAAYENGLGCRQSYARAAKWYRLAAGQGLAVAMSNLGFLHLHGYGVPADRTEALRWFRRGAEAGCHKARAMTEALLGEG